MTYDREALAGDGLAVNSRVPGFDARRLQLFHEMIHIESGDLAATNDVMPLHVDMTDRRTAGFPKAVLDRIGSVFQSDRQLRPPERAGRTIKIPHTSR